jgi:hypothetical protein
VLEKRQPSQLLEDQQLLYQQRHQPKTRMFLIKLKQMAIVS